MPYYTTGITPVGAENTGAGVVLWANTTHTGKVIQLYLSGQLVAWQTPAGGSVWFELPNMAAADTMFLLAVDTADAETDYFDEAYALAAGYGNRIRVRSPQKTSYLPGDRWKVYRGDAGDAEADTLVWDQDYYPDGYGSGGFGAGFGEGFGYTGDGAVGFGYAFGYGEFGWDCGWLEWTSQVLPPGTYPVKITVEDAAGNESTAATDSVTLTTYPRPATDLTIASYDSGTDTLTLSWIASPDIT